MSEMSKYVKLKVHPDSKKTKVLKKSDDGFEIWVKSKAERGQATRECLEILANEIKIDIKRLRVIKGLKTPSKIVEII
jgi:uncharacterized protein YggU (UPF0235/DUF167 family)